MFEAVPTILSSILSGPNSFCSSNQSAAMTSGLMVQGTTGVLQYWHHFLHETVSEDAADIWHELARTGQPGQVSFGSLGYVYCSVHAKMLLSLRATKALGSESLRCMWRGDMCLSWH